MATVLMVIAKEQFRDEEYAHPREVLERAGARVVTASTSRGACVGRFGLSAEADIALGDVDPQDLDAIVFVGGAGSKVYFDDPIAHRLARELHDEGKTVAAICIAPSVLAHAGLLAGRKVTSFPSQEEDLRAHGADFTGNPVEISGAIVTANGPEAAYEFGEEIARALGLT